MRPLPSLPARLAVALGAVCAVGSLAAVLLMPPWAAGVVPGENGRIAFSYQPHGGEFDYRNRGLYTVNPDGSDLRLIDRDGYYPAWSPDGTALAYGYRASYRGCTSALYVAKADGSLKRKIADTSVTEEKRFGCYPPADVPAPAWSSSGLIAFERAVEPAAGLAVVRPDGSGLRPFFNRTAQEAGWAGAERPEWSPDGSRLVFFHDERGYRGQPDWEAPGLYVSTADGSTPTRLSPPGDEGGADDHPSWSPDGSKIMFKRGIRTWIMNVDGSARATIAGDRTLATWSPDGTQMAWIPWSERVGGFYPVKVGVVSDGGDGSCIALVGDLNGFHDHQLAWQPHADPAPISPGRYCVARPTDTNDVIAGGANGDEICGLAGEDKLEGLGGADVLWGDACGDDGEPPTDGTLSVRASDRLLGGDGDDRLYGSGGKDRLEGGAGDDILSGGPGKDKLFGGAGNDKLVAGAQKNSYAAGGGRDRIDARNGKRDAVDCGGGKDVARVDARDLVRRCEKVKRARG